MQCLRVVCPFQFHRHSRKCLDVNNNSSRKYFDVLNISSEIKPKIKHQTTQSLEPCLHCARSAAYKYTIMYSHISCNRHYTRIVNGKSFSQVTRDHWHSTLGKWMGGIEMKKKNRSQHTVKSKSNGSREWMQKYDWMTKRKRDGEPHRARDKKATPHILTHTHQMKRINATYNIWFPNGLCQR